MLREVLNSGRWAISSPYRGELFERQLSAISGTELFESAREH
jgi:hypothetical protein